MDDARADNLARFLAASPSRREITRALLGLIAGSVLAPFLRFTEAEAKGKRKKASRRRKKRKRQEPQQCPAGSASCVTGQAGDLVECCSTAINPAEGEPYEFCTKDCGCCDLGFSNCCPGRGAALCCANSDTCHYGPNFEPFCCPAGTSECLSPDGRFKCCGNDAKCCSGECCPLTGNKCCPGKTGCFFPETPCPA